MESTKISTDYAQESPRTLQYTRDAVAMSTSLLQHQCFLFEQSTMRKLTISETRSLHTGHAALGAVLKNSHGHLVQEVQRYIGSGLTSGMAKYEALLAGMKKARSLHVNHLLAKCNSRLLIKQVILCRHHDPFSLSLSLSQPSQLTFLVLHPAPRNKEKEKGTSWSFNPGMRLIPFTAFPLMSAWVHPAPNLSNEHETPINGGNLMLVPDELVTLRNHQFEFKMSGRITDHFWRKLENITRIDNEKNGRMSTYHY